MTMTSSEATTRRRVKLYMLNGEREWDDKGTGHVSAICGDERNMSLMVISESDGSALLDSKIRRDTAYHRQQETLIVWSEGELDLALSFQENSGCGDIWEKICKVQGKDPSVDVTQEVVDESDDCEDTEGNSLPLSQGKQNIDLPSCEISHLEEISDLVHQCAGTQTIRDKFVEALEKFNYLPKLVLLFHKAESQNNSDALQQLFDIIRRIILFNNPSLYEILFSESMIMDVIGMLEYNPSGQIFHRDFLLNKASFKEVLPIQNADLLAKIHQTYRVQYIQDCCLPPPCLFDDNTLSSLKTFISLNKIEIIRSVQENEEFMQKLFARLRKPDISVQLRRDLAMFAREFCSLSVQTEQKDSALQCMYSHGALKTLEMLLKSKDKDTKSAALDILQAFVEHQASLVREYVHQESGVSKDNENLINIMITEMIDDTDPGALRLFRRIINMKEDFYYRYIIKNSLFKPILDLFYRNGHRYNLIDSAIIELFEFIRVEDIQPLIMHIIGCHYEKLRRIEYVQTFEGLKQAYNEISLATGVRIGHSPGPLASQPQLNVLQLVSNASSTTGLGANRSVQLGRYLDTDDDQWLEHSDEEDDHSSGTSDSGSSNSNDSGLSYSTNSIIVSDPKGQDKKSMSQVKPIISTNFMENNIIDDTQFKPRSTISSSDEEEEEDLLDNKKLPLRPLVGNALKNSQISINIKSAITLKSLSEPEKTEPEVLDNSESSLKEADSKSFAKSIKRLSENVMIESKRIRKSSGGSDADEEDFVEEDALTSHVNDENLGENTKSKEKDSSLVSSLVDYSDEEEDDESSDRLKMDIECDKSKEDLSIEETVNSVIKDHPKSPPPHSPFEVADEAEVNANVENSQPVFKESIEEAS